MTDEIPPGWLSQLATQSLWPRSVTGGLPMSATMPPIAMGPPDDLWQQQRPAWMDWVAEPASSRGILGDLSLPAGQSGTDPWRDAMSQAEEARRAAAERLQRSVLRPGPPAEPLTPRLPAADHLDSSGHWAAGQASPGPDQGSPAHGFYLAPVPRAPSWEQVVPTATPWSISPNLPSPTSRGEITSGIECRATAGNMQCITPGGRQFCVPAGGIPNGLTIAPGQPNYHYYSTPDGPIRFDPSALTQGVIDNPTVGPRRYVRPATPQGTLNEATPEWMYDLNDAWLTQGGLPGGQPFNPVKSYVTTDQNGTPIVVNVTEPDHILSPGIVIRYVTTSPSGSTIQNEGTGLGALQAPHDLLGHWTGGPIGRVWEGHAQNIVRKMQGSNR